MKMRLLITGAAGFIGTNLLKKLETRHDLSELEVLTVDMVKPESRFSFQKADLTNTDYSFLDSYKPTHVIHLAALTNHRLCASLDNAMDVNVYSTERLFSKLHTLGCVKKIVFPSSIVVYADHAKMPLHEENSPIDIHHNHYSLTKGLCEELCQHFRQPPYNLPILTLRLSNVYGPYQEWRQDKHPNLIPQIMRQAIQDKKIEIWNSAPVRDFVYVQDACDAFLKSLQSNYNGTINIASGIGTSVGEICQEISKSTGAPIIDLGKQTSGPSHVVCDIGKAKLHLDWQAQTPLKEGISKAIEYYKKSIPIVK